MDYHWDLEELKKDKYLYDYLMHFDEVKAFKPLKNAPVYTRLLRDFYNIDKYSFMKKLAKQISHENLGKSNADLYADANYFDISFDDVVAFTHDFYIDVLKTKPKLMKVFLENFKERETHIRLENYINQPNCGFAIRSEVLKKSYIQINKFNNINDLFALIHEYGHVISANYNERGFVGNPFLEFESTFMEYLAIEYFSKYSELNKIFTDIKQDVKAGHILGMARLNIRYAFENALKNYIDCRKSYNFNKKDLVKIILSEMNIDKKALYHEMSYDISFLLPYLAAEVYAFDFVNLYKQDPEYAIYLYQEMISFTGKDSASATYINKKVKKLGLNPVSSYKRF